MSLLARHALLPATAALLVGCSLLPMAQAPKADDLSTWSLTPLPPDPALAASAVGADGACRMDDPSDDVVAPVPQILVQDRRLPDTAAFLVLSATQFGDCLISRGGGSSSGWGPVLPPTNAPLTIEDRSGSTLGQGSVDVVGGRFAFPGARVVLELQDGRSIVASTANGYWLTWRPAFNGAKRVVVLAPDGTELASLEVPAE